MPCRFLDSAEALVKETGSSVAKYQVCDNIDLSTILQVCVYSMCMCGLLWCVCTCLCVGGVCYHAVYMQEYESYYFVKFKKTPKIIKRAISTGKSFVREMLVNQSNL